MDDERLGSELTSAASVVLANANAYGAAVELSEGRSEATGSRAVVEQA